MNQMSILMFTRRFVDSHRRQELECTEERRKGKVAAGRTTLFWSLAQAMLQMDKTHHSPGGAVRLKRGATRLVCRAVFGQR